MKRALLSGLAGLLVSACAVTPPAAPGHEAWEQRKQALQTLESWALEGRVAVSANEEGWNGTLFWTQEDADIDLRVRGPLGVGGFQLTGSTDTFRVVTSEGESAVYDDPEYQLERQFGWAVPVGSMRYWVLGAPTPGGRAHEEIDAEGRLTALDEDGWQIHYGRYLEVEGQALPRRVVIENGDVRVRVVVDRWELAAR